MRESSSGWSKRFCPPLPNVPWSPLYFTWCLQWVWITATCRAVGGGLPLWGLLHPVWDCSLLWHWWLMARSKPLAVRLPVQQVQVWLLWSSRAWSPGSRASAASCLWDGALHTFSVIKHERALLIGKNILTLLLLNSAWQRQVRRDGFKSHFLPYSAFIALHTAVLQPSKFVCRQLTWGCMRQRGSLHVRDSTGEREPSLAQPLSLLPVGSMKYHFSHPWLSSPKTLKCLTPDLAGQEA